MSYHQIANDPQGKGILKEFEADGINTSFLVVSFKKASLIHISLSNLFILIEIIPVSLFSDISVFLHHLSVVVYHYIIKFLL